MLTFKVVAGAELTPNGTINLNLLDFFFSTSGGEEGSNVLHRGYEHFLNAS